ncbi:MAG: F-type H+-transporting ATPase subunit a [Frankiaceae bacterium]|nr:F-type H+-transporting ATPase subunit a [Frankiaceae bacterium]
MIYALVPTQFTPPGPIDFEYPGIAGTFVTKPMLIIVLGSVAVAWFLWAASRRAAIVPGKLQYTGEALYGFVRNQIAIDSIGREGIKYVPYLATLFFFVAALNISGIIPLVQFPATSRIAIPLFLAIITWAIFNYIGMRRVGVGHYFKAMMFPPGIPKPVYVLLAPIELLSTFFFRPITLCLRLTFNMFAGHLVLLLSILGGEYLLTKTGGVVGYAAGSVSILGGIVLTAFEGFVQLLQAYVFTLLSALYIGGALADEH